MKSPGEVQTLWATEWFWENESMPLNFENPTKSPSTENRKNHVPRWFVLRINRQRKRC
jgi:hypothetical protein